MNENFTLAVTGQSLIKHDIRQITDPEFASATSVLRDADLAFTNFEGTILGSHGGWPLKGFYFGSSKPEVLDALREIGFRALSLSNNHSFDLGPSGILSTLEEVERRGFLYAGIGRNKNEAASASTQTFGQKAVSMVAMDGGPGPDFMYAADGTNGRAERPGVNRLRLSRILEIDEAAFAELQTIRDKAGYSALDFLMDNQPDDEPELEETDIGFGRAVFRRSNRFKRTIRIGEGDLARNLREIENAASSGSLVIAYLHHHHWASDWLKSPDWISAFARKCIDAGASVFVSHGVPVLLPIEIYRGQPIFHSLGNFIFHTRSEISLWQRHEVWESVIGLCSFGRDNRLTSLKLHPIVIGGEEGLKNDALEHRLAPHLATGAAAERILRRVAEESREYGARIEIADDVGIFDLT